MTQGMAVSSRLPDQFSKTISNISNDNCNVISCLSTLYVGENGMINWTMRNIPEHKYSVLFELLLRNTIDNSLIWSHTYICPFTDGLCACDAVEVIVVILLTPCKTSKMCHRFSLESISNGSFGFSNHRRIREWHGYDDQWPLFELNRAYDNAKLLVHIPNKSFLIKSSECIERHTTSTPLCVHISHFNYLLLLAFRL